MEKQPEITEEKTKPPKEKHRSFGNKMFDAVVYPIVQWVGVWAGSIMLASIVKNSKGGLNDVYNNTVNFLEPKLQGFSDLSHKITGNTATSKDWASDVVMIQILGLGGTALLPITKFLEDRRDKISEYFDKMAGKQVNQEEVKKEPKQSWFSLGVGRLIAIESTVVALAIVGPNALKWCGSKVGGLTAPLAMKLFPKADKDKVRAFTDLAVFDLVLTGVSATVTYIFSRKAAEAKDKTTKEEVKPIAKETVAINDEASSKWQEKLGNDKNQTRSEAVDKSYQKRDNKALVMT
jgi:hypothetical protein